MANFLILLCLVVLLNVVPASLASSLGFNHLKRKPYSPLRLGRKKDTDLARHLLMKSKYLNPKERTEIAFNCRLDDAERGCVHGCKYKSWCAVKRANCAHDFVEKINDKDGFMMREEIVGNRFLVDYGENTCLGKCHFKAFDTWNNGELFFESKADNVQLINTNLDGFFELVSSACKVDIKPWIDDCGLMNECDCLTMCNRFDASDDTDTEEKTSMFPYGTAMWLFSLRNGKNLAIMKRLVKREWQWTASVDGRMVAECHIPRA